MNAQTEKLILIYYPFLIIAISIIAGYTFLNWLLIIQLQLFSFKEIIIEFFAPGILSVLTVLIWLRPRIKLLNLKKKKDGDLNALYYIIAIIAITTPTVIAQKYIVMATGKLTDLQNISQINSRNLTKYYTLKDYYIDKNNRSLDVEFEVAGKHNEDFNMNLYYVLPILSSADDTLKSECVAWYGVKFHDRISNRLSNQDKERAFNIFLKESEYQLSKKSVDWFVYLDRIGNTDDHDGYVEATRKNVKYATNSKIIFEPKYNQFSDRCENKLTWIFASFGIGAIIWLMMVLIPKLQKKEVQRFESGESKKDKYSGFLTFLILLWPRKGFFITPILINMNILIFLIMVCCGLGFISFRGNDLLVWGANYGPATNNGEWWRLLTSTFLHGGIMHLLANMYGLLFVGIFLEPKLGKTKYAVIYLATGILASLASLWWHEATVSVGASGAIFGLYGLFLALMLSKVYPKEFNKALLLSTVIFIGFNLAMGITGGIDNSAHIGGLVSGFVIGLFMAPQLKEEAEQ